MRCLRSSKGDIEKYEADAAALRTLSGASLEDTAVEGKRASIKAIDVIEMHQADIQKYEESTEMLERIQAVNGKTEAGAV